MATVKAAQCVLGSVIALVLAAWFGSSSFSALVNQAWIHFIFTGVLSVVLLVLGLALADMSTMHPSNSHSWLSIFVQYFAVGPCVYLGRWKMKQLSSSGENKGKLQEAALLKLLKRNKDTLYGKEYKFSEISSREDYVKVHPLTTYEHFQGYVKRIVEDGEENVLSKETIEHFSLSSGTSGKNKTFPINSQIGDTSMMLLFSRSLAARGNHGLKRILALRYKPKAQYSKKDIPIAALTRYISPHLPHHVGPKELADIPSEKQAWYAHAVFALAEEHLGLVDGIMATLVLSFMQVIENNWQLLCDDISRGQINPGLDIPSEIRDAINNHLKPDPERADFLRKEFSKGFKDIVARIWPYLSGFYMVTTGTFEIPTKQLRNDYIGDELRVFGTTHAASEGMIGFAITDDPKDTRHVFLPTPNFYEFIEESESGEEQPKTYFLDQLEIGKSYEIVMTTCCGLYRYRLGDVVKIVGDVNNWPAYEFQYRMGQMLNLYWEKTPESVFHRALTRTLKALPEHQLVDYTAVENNILDKLQGQEQTSRHYIMFIELSNEDRQIPLTDQQKHTFDESLCEEFELYRSLRKNGSIDRMQVIQIRDGGFARLKFHMNKDSHNQQFKIPRALRNEEYLMFLLGEELKSDTHSSGLDENMTQIHPAKLDNLSAVPIKNIIEQSKVTPVETHPDVEELYRDLQNDLEELGNDFQESKTEATKAMEELKEEMEERRGELRTEWKEQQLELLESEDKDLALKELQEEMVMQEEELRNEEKDREKDINDELRYRQIELQTEIEERKMDFRNDMDELEDGISQSQADMEKALAKLNKDMLELGLLEESNEDKDLETTQKETRTKLDKEGDENGEEPMVDFAADVLTMSSPKDKATVQDDDSLNGEEEERVNKHGEATLASDKENVDKNTAEIEDLMGFRKIEKAGLMEAQELMPQDMITEKNGTVSEKGLGNDEVATSRTDVDESFLKTNVNVAIDEFSLGTKVADDKSNDKKVHSDILDDVESSVIPANIGHASNQPDAPEKGDDKAFEIPNMDERNISLEKETTITEASPSTPQTGSIDTHDNLIELVPEMAKKDSMSPEDNIISEDGDITVEKTGKVNLTEKDNKEDDSDDTISEGESETNAEQEVTEFVERSETVKAESAPANDDKTASITVEDASVTLNTDLKKTQLDFNEEVLPDAQNDVMTPSISSTEDVLCMAGPLSDVILEKSKVDTSDVSSEEDLMRNDFEPDILSGDSDKLTTPNPASEGHLYGERDTADDVYDDSAQVGITERVSGEDVLSPDANAEEVVMPKTTAGGGTVSEGTSILSDDIAEVKVISEVVVTRTAQSATPDDPSVDDDATDRTTSEVPLDTATEDVTVQSLAGVDMTTHTLIHETEEDGDKTKAVTGNVGDALSMDDYMNRVTFLAGESPVIEHTEEFLVVEKQVTLKRT